MGGCFSCFASGWPIVGSVTRNFAAFVLLRDGRVVSNSFEKEFGAGQGKRSGGVGNWKFWMCKGGFDFLSEEFWREAGERSGDVSNWKFFMVRVVAYMVRYFDAGIP